MNRPGSWEQVEGGLLGLLVGDALGVPYEFHEPRELPAEEHLQMVPPAGFPRSYAHIPPGTWSDDGAQALCLLESLLACRGWNPEDFASRLLSWFRSGHLAVDGRIFDVGIQTGAALERLAGGMPALAAGLSGERNNGNGSLMRVLPLALLHDGDLASLVAIAQEQSLLTHAHPRAQVCCAVYVLWARSEMMAAPDAWSSAVSFLSTFYRGNLRFLKELNLIADDSENPPSGTGYVVDCLLSARYACRQNSYEAVVQRAVSLGHDTDTTACVAGGIAGIRHGVRGIPARWMEALRGQELLGPLLQALRKRFC